MLQWVVRSVPERNQKAGFYAPSPAAIVRRGAKPDVERADRRPTCAVMRRREK